jgi:hypothetical protein
LAVAAGTQEVVEAAVILVEGVAGRAAEAGGREAGWDVEAWAAGEDNPIAEAA